MSRERWCDMIVEARITIETDGGDHLFLSVDGDTVTLSVSKRHSQDSDITVPLKDFIAASLAIRALDRP